MRTADSIHHTPASDVVGLEQQRELPASSGCRPHALTCCPADAPGGLHNLVYFIDKDDAVLLCSPQRLSHHPLTLQAALYLPIGQQLTGLSNLEVTNTDTRSN